MAKRVGVLRFPGTNCDRDVFRACVGAGHQATWLWYLDHFNPSDFDAFFLPGGFSFGDYLRCGALAARSPVLASLREASQKGKPIFGICNGFQILCEAGLLPGVLMRNRDLRFVDRWVDLKSASPSPLVKTPSQFQLPVAHAEGRFHIAEDGLKALEDRQQVWLRYISNPNGSVNDIAGIRNQAGNVLGLMPHPERAFSSWMGSDVGRSFFTLEF